MTVTAYALNLAADELTGRTVTIKLHTGDPGSAGTDNAVSGAEEDVAASGWSDASSGRTANSSAVSFGVLSTSGSTTVSHYSLWDSSNLMGYDSLSADVTVAANESFSLNADTAAFNLSST